MKVPPVPLDVCSLLPPWQRLPLPPTLKSQRDRGYKVCLIYPLIVTCERNS